MDPKQIQAKLWELNLPKGLILVQRMLKLQNEVQRRYQLRTTTLCVDKGHLMTEKKTLFKALKSRQQRGNLHLNGHKFFVKQMQFTIV